MAIAATPSAISSQPHHGIPPDSSVVACTVVSLLTVVPGGGAGAVTVLVFVLGLGGGGAGCVAVTVLVSVTVLGGVLSSFGGELSAFGGELSRSVGALVSLVRAGVVSRLASPVAEEIAFFALAATVPVPLPSAPPQELTPHASAVPAMNARTHCSTTLSLTRRSAFAYRMKSRTEGVGIIFFG